MNSLQNFNYNGAIIQRRQDDGYLNLTQMCQANGKQVGDFLRLKVTKAYLAELSAETGIPVTQLYQVFQGGTGEQGTWGHQLLALRCAQWISPRFAVWCDAHIFNLMETGQTSLAIDPIQEMKLKIELAKIEAAKEAAIAQAKKTDLDLVQFRHYVTTALPEPVQQKVLGYTVVKEKEVVETIVNSNTGRRYDGLGITAIAKELGFKTTAQCWAWLERHGYGKDSAFWNKEPFVGTTQKLPREHFDYLRHLIKDSGDRQLFLGE